MLSMRAIKGASWLVSSRLLGRLVDFFTLLLLARILTPADFGLTALAMTVVVILDTVLEVPVAQALLRLREVERRHLDTGFTLGLLRSLTTALIVLALVWPFSRLYDDSRLVPLLLVLALGPIARGLYNPNMVRFMRELSFRQTFITEFSGKLCATTMAVVTVLAGGGYWAIAANFVTAHVAATAASYVLAPYRPAISLSRLSDFASFIGWFTCAQIVSAVNWQFDRVLLGKIVDRATLGRYAMASDLAVFPTQSLVGPAMQPVMAAFSKIGPDVERRRLAFLKAARFTMLISAPMSIGIAVTADLIVALFLGPQWTEAAPYLQLIAFAVLPIPYFQTLYSVALAVDRPIVLFQLNIIDLGLRIVLVTAGALLFSVTGTIIARILVSALMSAFYLLFAWRLIGVSVPAQLKNIWKIAAASAVMAVSVAAARQAVAPAQIGVVVELVATAAFGALVYAGALYGFGVRLVASQARLELTNRWW